MGFESFDSSSTKKCVRFGRIEWYVKFVVTGIDKLETNLFFYIFYIPIEHISPILYNNVIQASLISFINGNAKTYMCIICCYIDFP